MPVGDSPVSWSLTAPPPASCAYQTRRPPLGPDHGGEECLELELGLDELAPGIRVGDHADAGEEPGPVALDLGRAYGDGPGPVAVAVDPADRPGVAAPVESLDLVQVRHRLVGRGAADGRGRMQAGDEIERRGRLARAHLPDR